MSWAVMEPRLVQNTWVLGLHSSWLHFFLAVDPGEDTSILQAASSNLEWCNNSIYCIKMNKNIVKVSMGKNHWGISDTLTINLLLTPILLLLLKNKNKNSIPTSKSSVLNVSSVSLEPGSDHTSVSSFSVILEDIWKH